MADGEIHVQLSVHYPDDPKIIAAGEKAELLYVRALCLAKRLLSDGFIAEPQLVRFGLSGVRARAAALVREGLWQEVDGGYLIVAWGKRNKARAEIEAEMEQRRLDGLLGNHRRWHTDKPDPKCHWCQEHRPPDRPPDTNGVAEPKRGPSPETETETETETFLAPAKPAPGGRNDVDPVWDAMVDACGLTGKPPTDLERGAWNTAAKNLRTVGATADEISRRAVAFRQRWPEASLTPMALARRWNECVATQADVASRTAYR